MDKKGKANMDLQREDYLKLYEITSDEEQYFLAEYHKRLEFYFGLITALITGTVVGIFAAKEWHLIALTVLGPIISFFVACVCMKTARSSYRRFLEAITVKAKIENELRLDNPQSRKSEFGVGWVKKEQIVNQRHIRERGLRNSLSPSSEDWVKSKYYYSWIIGDDVERLSIRWKLKGFQS